MAITMPGPVGLAPTARTTATPFHDLDQFLSLTCLSQLLLSPDGTRLVVGVVSLRSEGTGYGQALWEVDPAGQQPARRITRSTGGEHAVAFLPDGGLMFLSARPDPDVRPGDTGSSTALWLLPADSGEARVVATRPGGIRTAAVSREGDTVVLVSPTMPSAVTEQDDRRTRSRRAERRVTATLHDSGPVRYHDRDVGPEEPRLFAGSIPPASSGGGTSHLPDPADRGRLTLRDLTPRPSRALHDAGFDVSPDGSGVVTTWEVTEPGDGIRRTVVHIDIRTGERRTLLDDPHASYAHVACSPDGLRVAAVLESRTSPTGSPSRRLMVTGTRPEERSRTVADSWDRWPSSKPVWSPDGRALFVTADDGGRTPVFRVDLGDDERPDSVVRLSLDDGAYTDVQVSPDGAVVYALRSAVGALPVPVRLDARMPGRPVDLPVPVAQPALPGALTEVTTTAEDGTPLRGWLVLPEGADRDRPAPLSLWIHGGPHTSWSGWHWRWNPWLMAARGYAVLMPDPGLSTGYGDAFAARGRDAWSGTPYTDLMAITDAAEARPDIAAGRTVVMGASFGGYMANWIAGHTDRFVAIVSHAGVWDLDRFFPTSDLAHHWAPARDGQMSHSPHRSLSAIRTPMLIVHSGRDSRVPLTESQHLWTDLHAAPQEPSSPHRFLYFPEESHAVVAPQHIKVWYETVFAFLDTTVHGLPWVVPEILR
jgi:dipeptidyl aminopeptidase/acylaminoacyl peptidase